MKIAVLFVAHKYNESSIIGYNRLVNELDNNIYDVIWCAPFDVKVDDASINLYRYGNTFVKRDGFYNPSFILENKSSSVTASFDFLLFCFACSFL